MVHKTKQQKRIDAIEKASRFYISQVAETQSLNIAKKRTEAKFGKKVTDDAIKFIIWLYIRDTGKKITKRELYGS